MRKLTIDKQYNNLQKKLFFVKIAISNQRPRTNFNKEGVCSACNWAFEKNSIIDWEKREKTYKL